MGKYDSSLTRVQPLFDQLHQFDPTGIHWLGKLLAMGSRVIGKAVSLPEDLQWPGPLITPPLFEMQVLSPLDYLCKLVELPDRLTQAATHNGHGKRSPKTRAKREALMHGDLVTRQEAIGLLQQNRRPGNWWVLEGVTHVDCSLVAERARVCVEGKRTEPKLTEHIEWDNLRNQVFRNLDCLRSVCHSNTPYYGLLIVEKGSEVEDAARELDQVDRGLQIAKASWPHLDDAGARALYARYLGYTTWEDIHSAFAGTVQIEYPDLAADAKKSLPCGTCVWG